MAPNTAVAAVAIFDASGAVCAVLEDGEFDAVLFQAANLEFQNELVRAAYLNVDPAYRISGAVFFLMRTDSNGFVSQFEVPLEQMLSGAAAQGYPSPYVVTRNQCPLPEWTEALWQPNETMLANLSGAVTEHGPRLYREAQVVETPAAQDMLPAADQAGAPKTLRGLLGELEAARDEIRKLRSALRHEQDRNRRLQDELLTRPRP